jgi:hypothetical protein
MLSKKRPKSFTIISKKDEKNFKKKINSKILEEYIQNYNILEKQYKQLKQELSDSKTNLKISKEIIDVFMTKCSDPNIKFSEVIKSLNKKVNFYQEINSKLLEDNTTLNNLLNKHKLNMHKINNDFEMLKTKYFILEQSNNKKENTIQNLKNIPEIKYNYNNIIINPNEANIKLNSDLEYYKGLSDNLFKKVKKYKEKIDFYQKQVNYLQMEKEKLRMKNKEQKIKANKYKDNMFLYLRKTLTNIVLNDKNLNKSFNNTQYNDDDNKNIGGLNLLNNFHEKNRSRNPVNNLESAFENFMNKTEYRFYNLYGNNKNKNKGIGINDDDFVDILKQVGITQENFALMSKNQKNSKLIDIIEYMYKMIREKTQCINLLECENENLNQENFELNKKNMELMKSPNEENNSSIVANNSKITINNMNINTLTNYKKILNNNGSNSSSIQEEINKILNAKFNNFDSDNNKESVEKKNNININVIKFIKNIIIMSKILKIRINNHHLLVFIVVKLIMNLEQVFFLILKVKLILFFIFFYNNLIFIYKIYIE